MLRHASASFSEEHDFWIPLLFCDRGLDTQLAAVSQHGQKELSMFRAPFLAPSPSGESSDDPK